MGRATTSIDFAIFFLTDDGLRDALVAAHKRGVEVRGLWDRLGAESPYSGDEALCAAGIPIRTEDTVGKMHNKMMVIDATGENPRVITGSMNWSASGAGSNDENTVILRDGDVAERYAAEFKAMWDALGPATECGSGGSTAELAPDTRLNSGQVGIVSIVYNPEGDDVAGEYVMLENTGRSELDLTGWTLNDESDNTFTFPLLVLGSGKKVKVWVRSGPDSAENVYWGRDGAAVWNNSGDSAFLRDSAGTLIASCAYEGGGVEVDCLQSE